MRRAAGAGLTASAVGVVILPIIVAIGLGGSDEPTPPAPIQASLTVHHTGETPFTIAVDAPGAPPGSAQLISDKAGRNSAIVTPAPEECESIDDDLVRTPSLPPGLIGDRAITRWCLLISGLNAGSEVTGVIQGAAANLTLTVGVRHPYRLLPFLTTAAGLLAALVLLALPKASRVWVKRFRVDAALQQNDAAGPDRIEGLAAWVAERRNQGSKDADLLAIVDPLVRGASAARVAEKARASLQTNLRSHPDLPPPEDCTTVSLAYAELRSDHRRSDFIDDGGDRVAHPAAVAEANVAWFVRKRIELRQLAEAIGDLADPCGEELRPARDSVAQELKRLDPRTSKATLQTRLDQLRADVQTAQNDPRCERTGVMETRVLTEPATDPDQPATPESGTPRGIPFAALGALGILSTLVIMLASVLLMFVTVRMAAWSPKATFGTAADYWGVFSAALTSSAAATVFSALSVWTIRYDDG